MEACGCGRVLYAGGGAYTKHVYSLLVWPDLHHTHAVTAYIKTAFEYMLLPRLKICVCLLSYIYIQLAIANNSWFCSGVFLWQLLKAEIQSVREEVCKY